MNHYPILFISLGPGDPELITLKGWKALQAADIVFCPETDRRTPSKESCQPLNGVVLPTSGKSRCAQNPRG